MSEEADRSQATLLLRKMQEGSGKASEELFELLHTQLHGLARREMARQRLNHTLQPTALVNEIWLRLAGGGQLVAESKLHFMRIAAQAMRRVLVDHARRRATEKRGSEMAKIPLDEALHAMSEQNNVDLLVLDELLEQLRGHDERLADVVDMRFFAGLTEEETASALSLSGRQVQHAWKLARIWLKRQLDDREASD